ncbi:hypothetical protein PRIPAC_72065 [Pristionchus pacificus]|uniref:Uncharacterized protein n=1 Tax=Pristionchus pacificus TaxID=54126 RepID=A0A2A6CQR3_PRIPA|nr:hypothetical protein PRIPAC_72065 [Pristionchus pacificus]|eukprot:PDM80552.1 hypothetical protein PRIPAC_35555 [Pristionchus pacificus]
MEEEGGRDTVDLLKDDDEEGGKKGWKNGGVKRDENGLRSGVISEGEEIEVKLTLSPLSKLLEESNQKMRRKELMNLGRN